MVNIIREPLAAKTLLHEGAVEELHPVVINDVILLRYLKLRKLPKLLNKNVQLLASNSQYLERQELPLPLKMLIVRLMIRTVKLKVQGVKPGQI